MRGLSALALAGVVLWGGSAGALTSDELLEQGLEEEKAGQLDAALQSYSDAIAQDDQALKPRIRRALIHVLQNKCAEAMPDFDAFMHLTPQAERKGALWEESLLSYASCRRALKATLGLYPEQDARCRVDDGPPNDVPAKTGLSVEVDPGPRHITCTAASLSFQQDVTVQAQEHRAVPIHFGTAVEVGVAPSPEGQVSRDGEKKELPALPPSPSRPVEIAFGAGFGPSRGAFGLSFGLRFGNVGLTVGSGYLPFGAEATWYFNPGGTGFYLGAAYELLQRGLLGGGSAQSGHGVFGLGGIDVRPIAHLSIRLGVGAGYLTTERNSGPLTFDAAVLWLP